MTSSVNPGPSLTSPDVSSLSAPAPAEPLGQPSDGATRPDLTVSGWNPRVLLVDDDAVCRFAAKALLEKLGLTVDVAADGRVALEMSAAWPYAAIFLDCGMPEVDGYQAAREIRQRDGQSQGALVIALTSRPRSVCLASGMDHHIAKPVRIDVLAMDCRSLGLLSVADRPPIAHVEASAFTTPLLKPPPDAIAGISSARAAEFAATFVRRAPARLPELWRAANAADAGSLRRIAADLRERAARVGASRVADVCDSIARAAAGRETDLAASIEPLLRRALADTAEVIRSRLEMAAAPGAKGDAEAGAGQGRAATVAPERQTVRVVIADDDPLARLAIEAMIERADRLQLVGSAGDVAEIVDLVVVKRPDVAVLDWIMPGGGGTEAARQILERCPDTRVVALTASDSPEAFLAMLRAGASGLCVKGGSAEKLTAMIHRAAERSR